MRSRVLVFLLILCLLGFQQAAYAHALTHLPRHADSGLSAKDGDGGHALRDLLHPCATCAAFAAMDTAPGSRFDPALGGGSSSSASHDGGVPLRAAPLRPFDSRGPPFLL
ncbi:MAG: hypothetical protein AB1768_01825 [Pseudomonadota bacterium]|jgi:hypothetical protein